MKSTLFADALRIYGDRKIFARMLHKGCTEVAFGDGFWHRSLVRSGEACVTGVFIFFRPQYRVFAALEYRRFQGGFGDVRNSRKVRRWWFLGSFNRYLKRWSVFYGPRYSLREVFEAQDPANIEPAYLRS